MFFFHFTAESVFEVTDPPKDVEYFSDECGNRYAKVANCEGKDAIGMVFHCLSSDRKSKSIPSSSKQLYHVRTYVMSFIKRRQRQPQRGKALETDRLWLLGR